MLNEHLSFWARSVDALLLLSTPVESHPLLFDARFARIEAPKAVPKVYSLSGVALKACCFEDRWGHRSLGADALLQDR